MEHLNDNRLCIVTAFLTGPDAQQNDIIQICIVVLNNNFDIDKESLPFIANMEPRRGIINKDYLGNKYKECINILQTTADPYLVADKLDEWFKKNMLKETKKIMPLAYNWALISRFIIDWLGIECFNQYFDYRYRDVLPATLYCNDRAYTKVEAYPFPKHHLSYIASSLKVDYTAAQDKMLEVIAISKIYQKMMHTFVGI
jgi:hypothetical protein